MIKIEQYIKGTIYVSEEGLELGLVGKMVMISAV